MSSRFEDRRRLLGFSVANLVFGGLPRKASYVLMAVVGWVVATILPGRVAGLRANLEHVYPEYSPAQVTDLMQRNAKNYGKFWVDLFKMPRLSPAYKNSLATIEGEGNWKAAMAPGKGCVVVTIHMGGWEGCASLWGGTSPYRTGLIAEVLEPPELWERVLKLRQSSGLSIIPLSHTAARDILRRLKNNEMVAGAIDRDLLGSGRPFKFFSGTIDVPTGLIDIAQRSGAPVLPVICLRNADDTYKFIGMEAVWVGPEPGAVDDAARQVLLRFEACIRANPDQWHVMAPIFKGAPVAAPRPMPARLAAIPATDLEERVG
jgi:phosphatidylinositol dimannoside acyltransferase